MPLNNPRGDSGLTVSSMSIWFKSLTVTHRKIALKDYNRTNYVLSTNQNEQEDPKGHLLTLD